MTSAPAPLTTAVVVCAYTERRWDDLVAAVASARAQEPAPDEVVVVIDHNPALAARARDVLGAVTLLENDRRRGLSGARNTALAHLGAGPDVVAFLDDDATARPGWLAALLAPYADDDVAAVGGVAEPVWPGERAPDLLPRELWWVVGCSFTGQGTGDVRNLMGCSMSFRTKALAEAGEFVEEMGRVGTVPLGCEETELCIRLGQVHPGARIVLTPDAVVDHRVSADRVTWGYLRRRAYAEGLSKSVVAARVGRDDGLAAERAYTRAVLPRALGRELARAARALPAGDLAAAGNALRAAAAVPLALAGAGTGLLRGRVAKGRARP